MSGNRALALFGLCLTALCSAALALAPDFATAATRGKRTAAPAAQAPSGPAPSPNFEAVAAVVNDEVISTFDVRQRMRLILAGAGIQPTEEVLQQVQAQALRGLIDEHIQMQEAKDKKVTIDDADVEAAIAEIARANNTTADKLAGVLNSSGIGISTLRAQVRAELAWRRLVGGRYGARVRVSDTQVQDTMDRIAANATKPQYQVAEILLAAEGEKEIGEAKLAAARLIEEIKKGASFPMVARQFSSAPTAAAGGDLGWLNTAQIRPEILSALERMEPGSLADQPIVGPTGVYIIALRDKRNGVDPGAARVTLKQVAAPKNERAALDRNRKRLDCTQTKAPGVNDARFVDLGEVAERDMTDEMRTLIESVPVGQSSAVYDSPGGPAVLLVCARDITGGAMPTKQQVEDQLVDQELAMLSQRYLRNLRRDSTIITR